MMSNGYSSAIIPDWDHLGFLIDDNFQRSHHWSFLIPLVVISSVDDDLIEDLVECRNEIDFLFF